MTIIEKTGDLFTSDAKMLGHGTNTLGVMGAGIAVQFKNRFPIMHYHYENLCSMVPSERLVGTAAVYHDSNLSIANIFSQDMPGSNARWSWLKRGVSNAMNTAYQNGISKLAIPRIGCGIGGLDWDTTKPILIDSFNEHPVDLEIWSLD